MTSLHRVALIQWCMAVIILCSRQEPSTFFIGASACYSALLLWASIKLLAHKGEASKRPA